MALAAHAEGEPRGSGMNLDDLCVDHPDALRELTALRDDRDRLDWLFDRSQNIANVQLPTECVMAHFTDPRAAIDAARNLAK